MNLNGKRVVIAKTNHIGDVVISLAMAGLIKKNYPKARVIFLCKAEVCDIARMCQGVDEVHDWQTIDKSDDRVGGLKALRADVFIHANPSKKLSFLVKEAGVAIRVGSVFRLFQWVSCNRLAFISRWPGVNKRVLDLQFLKPLGIDVKVNEQTLMSLSQLKHLPLKKSHQALLSADKFNLVLHPGAKTAKENGWGVDNYKQLIHSLDQNKFQIIISGSNSERQQFSDLLEEDGVVDLMGCMSLINYINFLHYIDGMVAGSTGPLHLANAQKKHTLGLYRHNTTENNRWCPIGDKSSLLSDKKGVQAISVERVKLRISDWLI